MDDHPSNILYRGECTHFDEALRLYVAALRYEEQALPRWARKMGITLDPEDWNSIDFTREKEEAWTYLEQYREHLAAMQEQFAMWLEEQGTELSQRCAEALRNGDYSGLAI